MNSLGEEPGVVSMGPSVLGESASAPALPKTHNEHGGSQRERAWRLPPHWRVVTLGEIADVTGGVAKDKKRDAQEGIRQVPYLRVANVQRGYLDLTEVKTIAASEGEIQELRLRPGDVLFNEGGDRDKLGRGWVWNGEIEECIHQNHVFRARIDGRIVEPKFLSHWANSFGQDWFARAGKQTTNLASISLEKLNQFPVLLPSAAEQERIVARIEELFSDLDAGIAALERVRKKLRRYRSAVLHVAVTGRLTAERRKTHGTPAEPSNQLLARILIERRKQWEQRTLAKYAKDGRTPPKKWQARYVEPAGPNTADLPELPEGWCWASVDQCADVQGGLQKSPARAPVKNHYPYLRVANVLRGRLDLAELHRFELDAEELDKLRLESGDLLIVEGNGSVSEIGRSALWHGKVPDCVHQNHIIRCRFAAAVIPDYADIFVNSAYGQQYMRRVASSSSGLHTLSVLKVRSIAFSLPPEEEQPAIIEAVNEKLSQIDAMEAEVERGLARAGRLRQSILKAAFEGKLVPQDPADEPAAALLERIRGNGQAHPSSHSRRARRPRRRVALDDRM